MIDISTNSKAAAGRLAFRTFWQIRREVNLAGTHTLKPFGVGMKQAVMIMMLDKNGKSSQAEMSRKTGSDPAAIGRAIEVLKKRGWIEQHDHPSDRRRWEVDLTPQGRVLAKKVVKVFNCLEKQFSESLSRKETQILAGLLKRVLQEFTPLRSNGGISEMRGLANAKRNGFHAQ